MQFNIDSKTPILLVYETVMYSVDYVLTFFSGDNGCPVVTSLIGWSRLMNVDRRPLDGYPCLYRCVFDIAHYLRHAGSGRNKKQGGKYPFIYRLASYYRRRVYRLALLATRHNDRAPRYDARRRRRLCSRTNHPAPPQDAGGASSSLSVLLGRPRDPHSFFVRTRCDRSRW